MAVIKRLRPASNLYLLFSFLLIVSPVLFASEVRLNEDESLIVEVRIKQFILSDAILIYHQPDYTLVPLGELLSALEFPIEVNPDRLEANGWFIQESNSFNGNFQDRTVYIRGEKVEIPAYAPIISDGFDIFVDIRLINTWFNLSIELITSQLTLNIVTELPLPMLQRLDREKKRASLTTSKTDEKKHPYLADQYQLFGNPVFSTEISLETTRTEENEHEPIYAYRLQGYSDMLYHETRYSLIGGKHENFRFSWHRQPVSNQASLPLGMTEYSFGDIVGPNENLIDNASGGVGIVFKRSDDNRLSDTFNRKVLEGDAPPGWEVELYANSLLIDFQVVGDEGRYLFEDVPIQFGENVFDIRIYGPQGQIRNRRETYQVSDSMIKPGDFTYQVAFLRERDQIVSSSENINPQNNINLKFNYGMFSKHTVGLSLNQLTPGLNGEQRHYQSTTLISAWPFASTSIKFANEEGEGHASSFILATRAFEQDISVEISNYSDFISDTNPQGSILHKAEISLFGYRTIYTGKQITYRFNFEENKTKTNTNYRLDNSLSMSLRSWRIANELLASDTGESSPQLSGNLNLNHLGSEKKTRAGLSYQVSPDLRADSFQITHDVKLKPKDISYQLRTNIGLTGGSRRAIGFNISKHLKAYSLSLNGDLDNKNEYSLQLSILFGFGFTTETPYVTWVDESEIEGGTLNTLVYLDEDGDHTYSDQDTPLNGIQFFGRPNWKDLKTDDEGKSKLTNLNSSGGTLIKIDKTSLEDPYLRPYQPEVLVFSHAGGENEIKIPVTYTTEIEGQATLEKNNQAKAASGVKLILKDASGNQVSQVTTEFDGFFFFNFIPPGDYWIELAEGSYDKEKYKVNTPLKVTTDSSTGITYAPDIIIRALK